MSDSLYSDVTLQEFQEFKLNSLKTDSKKSKKDKKLAVLKIIAVIMVFLIACEAIFYFLISPSLTPVKVSVSGLHYISPREVTEKLATFSNATFLRFNEKEADAFLMELTGIESVEIEKHFPDRINIKINERIPVAQTLVTTDDETIAYQIDRNGVLWNSASMASFELTRQIPLISGIPFENLSDGSRLPLKYRSLIENIGAIRQLPQNYLAAISEIQVVPKEYGNYELVLYPVNSRIKVLCDRSLNENALKYMMVALDVVNEIEPGVKVVDLRYGSVSYR